MNATTMVTPQPLVRRQVERRRAEEVALLDAPIGGLEEFDDVASWVLEEHLGAARTGDHVISECHSGCSETVDLASEIRGNKVMRFQPPGPGRAPSGMARPAELFGPLKRSRKLPRRTSANAGSALENSWKPRCVV